MTDWQTLATESHYQTAVAIKNALDEGKTQEARRGIEELIDALARADRRALRSQLTRLMAHIFKCYTQPHNRSHGWIATIENAREEIWAIQEDTPSLTDAVLMSLWPYCLRAARRDAQGDMNQPVTRDDLTWEEVFDAVYTLE